MNGAYLKHPSLPAPVEEFQGYSVVSDFPVNIQLVGQGTRRADTFLLLRDAEDHVIQTGLDGDDVSAGELER